MSCSLAHVRKLRKKPKRPFVTGHSIEFDAGTLHRKEIGFDSRHRKHAGDDPDGVEYFEIFAVKLVRTLGDGPDPLIRSLQKAMF
jgi:hypothetical protein